MGIYSTIIKVPVSTLRENATRIQVFAEDNADIFDRIYNILQAMESSGEWQGVSASKAAKATLKNKKKFSEAVSELNSLAEFLKDFSDEMVAEDQDIKNTINL